MNTDLKFGIEEEYFLTDLDSRRLSQSPPSAAIQACAKVLDPCFAYEMFKSQIEVASPVFTRVADAAKYLSSTRTLLQRTLEPYGLGLLSAGSHPLADWRTQHATEQPHFVQLFDNYRHVAQRSLLSGLHVHVEVPGSLDRIRVMNEVLPWTPLLLALSCSSPFWEGVDSGFKSYRQTACDEWPRMGIPEHFDNHAAYDTYIDVLLRNGAIKQASDCWWGVRPATKYPTLELRMTDACPRLEDALCLASFFRLLVAHAIERSDPGEGYSHQSRWLLMENRWRAKRYGLEASFIVEGFDRPFSTEQWLFRAEQIMGDTATELGVQEVFSQARRILAEGSSAERQLGMYARALSHGLDGPAALSAVVDQLLRETAGVST